ncbi:MAG: hypothetical protein DBX91_02970 [Subdoligranulum variabile]|nr:MAG: hypothetical protein DBX91_02970 [Subdoligranulum variabile]
MKTKTKRRLAGAAGILIVLALLLFVDAFTGDPISRAWAEWQAVRRAENLYPGQTFYVERSSGGGSFIYQVDVQSMESRDTHFTVSTRFWLFVSDRAEELVENGWNTCYRMGEEAAEQAAVALAKQAPELELAAVYGAEKRRVELDLAWEPSADGGRLPYTGEYAGVFARDAAFDPAILQKVPSRLCVQVLWNGAPDEEDLAEVQRTVKQVMEDNGFPIAWYDITLVPMDGYDSYEELQGMVVESGPVAAADIA